eukprot:TRINITY_DN10244_c0_g1_i1.p1 TRINITY_DN10244_c0_g1~~TRINITY_DN10244_c0_g1_i1.p1  ORF type:complete len:706 (-),score=242.00 TRINITY_DN10244_c0_g1_i1:41-2158(-)
MGVSTLTTFVNENTNFDIRKVSLSTLPEGNTEWGLIFDGDSLKYDLYRRFKLDWSTGGQYPRFQFLCQKFFSNMMASTNFSPIFVFDGPRSGQRAEDKKRRAKGKLDKVTKVIDGNFEDEFFIPLQLTEVMIQQAKAAGIECVFAARKANARITALAQNRGNCWVVSNDSDYMMYDIPGYVQLDQLNIFESANADEAESAAFGKLTQGSLITVQELVEWLGIPADLLPIFGTLCGNDFVHRNIWRDFHAALRAQMEGEGGAGSSTGAQIGEGDSSAAATVGKDLAVDVSVESLGSVNSLESDPSSSSYRKNAELVRDFLLRKISESKEAPEPKEEESAKAAAEEGEEAQEEEEEKEPEVPLTEEERLEKMILDEALSHVDAKSHNSVSYKIKNSLKWYRSNGIGEHEHTVNPEEQDGRMQSLWTSYLATGDQTRVALAICETGYHAHNIMLEPWLGYDQTAYQVTLSWWRLLYSLLPLKNDRVAVLYPDFKKHRLTEETMWDFSDAGSLNINDDSWMASLASQTHFQGHWDAIEDNTFDDSVWVLAFILHSLYQNDHINEHDVSCALLGYQTTQKFGGKDSRSDASTTTQSNADDDDFKLHSRLSSYVQSLWGCFQSLYAIIQNERGEEPTDFPSIADVFDGPSWLTAQGNQDDDLDDNLSLLFNAITNEIPVPSSKGEGSDDESDSDDDAVYFNANNPYAALGM